MKLIDVYMISLAVAACLRQGILTNFILACVAVYFIAWLLKRGVRHGT